MEISFNQTDLAALSEMIAESVAKKIPSAGKLHNGKLLFTEQEAAEMFGMEVHQLRGERIRERIDHVRVVRNGVRYTLDQLLAYSRRGTQRGTRSI